MNDIPFPDRPAFPVNPSMIYSPGLSRRAYMASQLMAGLLAGRNGELAAPEVYAAVAVKMTDALITELCKRKETSDV